MPGLLRGIARTAVVAGTATAVSNRVSRRQAGRWAAKEQQQNAQPEAAQPQGYQQQPRYEQHAYEPPVTEDASGDAMSNKLAQLKELGELRSQGVLTDAEFEAQKRRILG
jgi:transcription initiation factor TFIID subunit TAF12